MADRNAARRARRGHGAGQGQLAMDKFYDAADDATDGMPVKEAPEAVVLSLEDKSKTYGCVFGRACEHLPPMLRRATHRGGRT